MTAREIWRWYYRRLRVLRREQMKANQDMMIFGTGAVMIPEQGDPYHVPANEFLRTRARLP